MAKLLNDETGIRSLTDKECRRELDVISKRLLLGQADHGDAVFLRELTFEVWTRQGLGVFSKREFDRQKQ